MGSVVLNKKIGFAQSFTSVKSKLEAAKTVSEVQGVIKWFNVIYKSFKTCPEVQEDKQLADLAMEAEAMAVSAFKFAVGILH